MAEFLYGFRGHLETTARDAAEQVARTGPSSFRGGEGGDETVRELVGLSRQVYGGGADSMALDESLFVDVLTDAWVEQQALGLGQLARSVLRHEVRVELVDVAAVKGRIPVVARFR